MTKPSRVDLTKGNILHVLLVYSAPFFVASVLQQLYSLVDMVIVGHFIGSAGMSAVSIGSQYTMILTVVCIGLTNGGQIVIAQFVGAERKGDLNQVIGTLFSASILMALFMTIIGLCLYNPVLRWLNTPPESFSQARDYMVVTSIGTIFMFGYNTVSAALRGLGDSTRPMIFIGVASVINALLDLLFVGVFQWGVMGAAIATVIAQACSLIFAVRYIYKRKEQFFFDFKLKSFKIIGIKLKMILQLGVPGAIEMSAIMISMAYIISIINVYGVAASAAYAAGNKLDHILRVPAQAINQSTSTAVGQNAGAGKIDRIRQYTLTAFALSFATSLIAFIVIRSFPEALFGIFNADQEVLKVGLIYIKYMSYSYFGLVIMSSFGGLIKGVGNSVLAMISGLTDGVILRLSLTWLFTSVLDMGLPGVFLGSMLAPFGAAAINFTYFLTGKWKYRSLIRRAEPQEPELAEPSP